MRLPRAGEILRTLKVRRLQARARMVRMAKCKVETRTTVDECQKKWSNEEFIPTNEDVESAKSLGKAENIFVHFTSILFYFIADPLSPLRY